MFSIRELKAKITINIGNKRKVANSRTKLVQDFEFENL